MAKDNLKRRLTSAISFIAVTVSMFCMNVSTALASVLVNIDGTVEDEFHKTGGVVDISEVSNNIFNNLRFYLNGAAGIALITVTLAFVIKCGQLAATADNAQRRANHITGMIWTIIAVSALGLFSTVMSMLAGFANGI